MVEDEARQVVEFIEKHVSNVDAGVQRPGQSVRLVWDRDSVVMIRDGLPALRASGGLVYQGMIDDLDYWLMNVAEPRTPES